MRTLFLHQDGPETIDQLRTRVALRKQRRERMKAINRTVARLCAEIGLERYIGHGASTEVRMRAAEVILDTIEAFRATDDRLTVGEVSDLRDALRTSFAVGYPLHAFSSIAAQIRADEGRIEDLENLESDRRDTETGQDGLAQSRRRIYE